MKKYINRIQDDVLQNLLSSSGAVLIEGPKWCGKTWLGRHSAKSEIDLQDPDKGAGYRKMAEVMPSHLLKGNKPLLIDEWQDAPSIWDAVRYSIDKEGLRGQYILTGSTTPSDFGVDGPRHTGTGRISRMRLRTMSLFESGESNGTVSLAELFKGNTDIVADSNLDIPQIARAICRGGWPETIAEGDNSNNVSMNYVDAVINHDIQSTDSIDRNPLRVRLLLRSYARNISTFASLQTVLDDIRAHDTTFGESSLYSYANALRRMFIIEDTPAWRPSLRSKTAIRTSDKRQFVDPSIATAVMNVDADGILNDFELFGFLFESLVTRDLRIYSQPIRGEILHYHDKTGLEADLIIRLQDGKWAAVEVKLGSREIDDGAKHLLQIAERVDTTRIGSPSFLMVVTGGQFAYKREDGVLVIPLGCLRP